MLLVLRKIQSILIIPWLRLILWYLLKKWMPGTKFIKEFTGFRLVTWLVTIIATVILIFIVALIILIIMRLVITRVCGWRIEGLHRLYKRK